MSKFMRFSANVQNVFNNDVNDFITLGRGGSDTTAVALSAALNFLKTFFLALFLKTDWPAFCNGTLLCILPEMVPEC